LSPKASVTLEDIERSQLYPRVRTAIGTDDGLYLMRFSGVLIGLVVVALTLHLALVIGVNWWWLAGLFVAIAPWFVEADRWVMRFDPAILAVAISVVALFHSSRSHRLAPITMGLIGIQTMAAVSLLLLAPPLWWLGAILLFVQPWRPWRLAAFATLSLVVGVPALRSPIHWINATTRWDTGAAAACVWVTLALALWHFPRLTQSVRRFLAGGVLMAGVVSLVNVSGLPSPTSTEWELVTWLQHRIPDQSVVRFDAETWHLSPTVSCPLGAHLMVIAQPIPPVIPSLPGTRDVLPADFLVTTDPAEVAASSYIHDLGNGFYIGREFSLPNSVDIRFGDLLYVLSYQLVTPSINAGDLVDVRLDFQLTSEVTVEALAYSAFFHVTIPGQAGDKVAEYNVPLVQEFQSLIPRQLLLNIHFRFPVPAATPSGTYDVIFGIYNVYTGERLRWLNGDSLFLGQLDVHPS
jgi:hypothetical protein